MIQHEIKESGSYFSDLRLTLRIVRLVEVGRSTDPEFADLVAEMTDSTEEMPVVALVLDVSGNAVAQETARDLSMITPDVSWVALDANGREIHNVDSAPQVVERTSPSSLRISAGFWPVSLDTAAVRCGVGFPSERRKRLEVIVSLTESTTQVREVPPPADE